MTDEELLEAYNTAVDAAMHRANERDGFASNMSRESRVAGLRAIERAAAARARGEALIEVVQAHRDLHKTYGSTVACRGGIGGQALTSHCGEICCNADAHQKEMEAWQKLEIEAIEYSRARAEAYTEGKLT